MFEILLLFWPKLPNVRLCCGFLSPNQMSQLLLAKQRLQPEPYDAVTPAVGLCSMNLIHLNPLIHRLQASLLMSSRKTHNPSVL